MKKLFGIGGMGGIVMLACIFLFTGCVNKEPEVRIIKEQVVSVSTPTEEHYTFVEVPKINDQIINMTQDEALNELSQYSIQLQSVIKIYEDRVEKLKEWKKKTFAKYLEEYDNVTIE